MTHAFRQAHRKIALAQNHLQSIKAEWNAYAESKPWTQVAELDRGDTVQVHKLKLTHELPISILDHADTIVGALRASLDKACFASRKGAGKNTQFPIANTAVELDRDVIGGRNRCRDIHPEIVAFVRALNPYKGGHNTIWAVNHLANSDKHADSVEAVLAPLGPIKMKNVVLSTGMLGGRAELGPYWDGAKQELILAVTGAGAHFEGEVQFTIGITFRDHPGLTGIDAIRAFEVMIQEFNDVVLGIEREALRLGIVE